MHSGRIKRIVLEARFDGYRTILAENVRFAGLEITGGDKRRFEILGVSGATQFLAYLELDKISPDLSCLSVSSVWRRSSILKFDASSTYLSVTHRNYHFTRSYFKLSVFYRGFSYVFSIFNIYYFYSNFTCSPVFVQVHILANRHTARTLMLSLKYVKREKGVKCDRRLGEKRRLLESIRI